jgi:hypothetical protein
MPSTATLVTMRARVGAYIGDRGGGHIKPDQIDEGLRLALEDYTRASLLPGARVSANEKIGTITPTALAREFALSSLSGLLDVRDVWFPYYAALPEADPEPAPFVLVWNAGAASLRLLEDVPDGVLVARIFYRCRHTLNGLDAASSTTYDAVDDGLLVLGGAGHACTMQAVGPDEVPVAGTPYSAGLAGVGKQMLAVFHNSIKPRQTALKGRSALERPAFVKERYT